MTSRQNQSNDQELLLLKLATIVVGAGVCLVLSFVLAYLIWMLLGTPTL